LKIDKTFVRDILTDPDDAAITKAIISLGHALDIKVLAEGVETAEQMHWLRANGCDEAQGFYFSSPLAIEELTEFVRQASSTVHSGMHGNS
jgi:EAL domain-containing protein (putative c-di-GMP-specific phosphodiesterase class I)